MYHAFVKDTCWQKVCLVAIAFRVHYERTLPFLPYSSATVCRMQLCDLFQNESKLELADVVAFACLYLPDKQVLAYCSVFSNKYADATGRYTVL